MTHQPAPWAVHRRLYNWVLSFAHHKHSSWALFIIAFAESSFFPIPPDVLLAPMCLGYRKKALRFAAVCTIGSVAGALLGYAIGWGAWESMNHIFFDYVPGFSHAKFDTVRTWYDHWGVWVLFAAAFTPIPFKVFTIAGGVFVQPLLPFVFTSIIGRGLRFFLVAILFRWVGPKATPLIDKYFNLLCVAFIILLLGGFAAVKLLH